MGETKKVILKVRNLSKVSDCVPLPSAERKKYFMR